MKKFIFGNWKMNMNIEKTKYFFENFVPKNTTAKIVLFVPSTLISQAKGCAKFPSIEIGAQNLYYEKSGAYTGEISAEQVLDAGATYVLIGHSERRIIFGEESDMISKKLQAGLAAGLKCVLCVGEALYHRKEGHTKPVLEKELGINLRNIDKKYYSNIIIAYEPVWAIGTGVSAETKDIEEVVEHIIKTANKITGHTFPVIYGGSVSGGNAKEIMKLRCLSGVLVGGASLNHQNFDDICEV